MFVRFLSVLRNEAGEGDGGGGEPASNAAPSPDNALQRQEVRPRAKHAEKREAVATTARALKEELAARKTAEKAPKAAEPADDKPEPKAADKAKAEPAESAAAVKAERTAEKIEDEGGKAPDQKKDETDKQYELRLSRALQDLRNAETVTKREKARAEAAERERDTGKKELDKLVKQLERGKNPEDALDFIYETTGLTFEDLVKNINDGKTKPVGAKPKLPPEVQERIDAQDAELKRLAKLEEDRQEQTKQTQQKERFDGHVKEAGEFLKANLDEFPLLQRIGWTAANLVQAAYRNGGDLSEPARRLQNDIVTDFAAALEEDKALDLLDKKLSKEAKAKLGAKYGAKVAPAAVTVAEHTRKPAAPPISRASTEAPAPPKVDKKASKRDQVRVAARLFEQSFRRQG